MIEADKPAVGIIPLTESPTGKRPYMFIKEADDNPDGADCNIVFNGLEQAKNFRDWLDILIRDVEDGVDETFNFVSEALKDEDVDLSFLSNKLG